MPNYTYECNKCHSKFELFSSISEYQSKPKCQHCQSLKTQRSYEDDMRTISASVKKSDNELKTVGDLANRNRDKMSNDEKNHLHKRHNSYKEEQIEKPLPKGMTRLKKQNKIKWT